VIKSPCIIENITNMKPLLELSISAITPILFDLIFICRIDLR